MKEDKMKKIFDKIIIGIFTILCLYAFFMIVKNLPYAICFIIGYDKYDGGGEIISFFVCCALLGYVLKYFENKQNNKINEIQMKHNMELNALKKIYKLNDFKSVCISKIFINELGKIQISILDKYNIFVELYLFDKIKENEDFIELDTYIDGYIKQNLYNEYEYKEFMYNTKIETAVKEYLESK